MAIVACAKCQTALPIARLTTADQTTCTSCHNTQTAWLFPALMKPAGELPSAAAAFEGDSACYYDPDKRAVAICDDCGRFISDFHRVVLTPEHTTCLACLSEGRNPTSKALTQRDRTVYDNFALAMAIVPPLTIVGIYFMVFTAPAALFLVIRYWKKGSNSVIPRGRWRFVVAAAIACLELVAVVGIAIAIFFGFQETF